MSTSEILAAAEAELAKQDARRGNTIKVGGKSFPTYASRSSEGSFQSRFARSIAAEIEMVCKHNVTALTGSDRDGNPIVVRPVRSMRPWLYRWIKIKLAFQRIYRKLFRGSR